MTVAPYREVMSAAVAGRPSWRLLVAATLIIGAAWATLIPPFEGLDEHAYYQAVMRPSDRPDRSPRAVENPLFSAASNQRGRINAFLHGRVDGASRADLARLYFLRAITIAAWIGSLIMIFATARLVFGQNDLALLTAGLCLAVPGVTFLASTVHPIAIAVLLGSAAYWWFAARALDGAGRGPLWIVGAAALAIAALRPLPQIWWPDDARQYLFFDCVPRLFFGFCGWLGQQSLLLPAAVYAALAAAVIVAACGVVLRVVEAPLTREQQRVAAVFVAGLGLTFVVAVSTNLLIDRTAATGAWLYVSIAPIMIALVAGVRWAAMTAHRSPYRLALPLAVFVVAIAAIWLTDVLDLREQIQFNYTGDPDHLARTISYTIVFLFAITVALVLPAWRARAARSTGAAPWPFRVVLVAWLLNLVLFVGFVMPRYSPLDAGGLAAVVREAAADGDVARATAFYRLAAAAYPDSPTLTRVVIDVPALELKGRGEPMFSDLRRRLARGELLTDRAELMTLARAAQLRQPFDPELLRAIAHHIANRPDLQEPTALIRAQSERRLEDGSATDVIRAAGGIATPHDMHGDAALEGFTVRAGASDRSEVTVYFRPLGPWFGKQLWVHAYPEGTHEYESLLQTSPAFAHWRTGALAWETFVLPSNAPFVLYVGVEVDRNLGPAYRIGTVR